MSCQSTHASRFCSASASPILWTKSLSVREYEMNTWAKVAYPFEAPSNSEVLGKKPGTCSLQEERRFVLRRVRYRGPAGTTRRKTTMLQHGPRTYRLPLEPPLT